MKSKSGKSNQKIVKGKSSARWMCEHCGNRFNDFWSFEDHVQVHEKPEKETKAASRRPV